MSDGDTTIDLPIAAHLVSGGKPGLDDPASWSGMFGSGELVIEGDVPITEFEGYMVTQAPKFTSDPWSAVALSCDGSNNARSAFNRAAEKRAAGRSVLTVL